MKQSAPINKVSVITLGCSKNIVDSEFLIGSIKSNGLEYSENINKAEVLIINTCGFIGPAKQESIDVILEAAELKKSGKLKKLIVTGCLSERYSKELKAQITDVDYFFGVNSYADILKSISPDLKFELLGARQLLTPSHYAYLKISEGCNHECSFCAIPFIRGKYISRPENELVDETTKLVEQGVKELIVIAQDTTYYGKDTYGESRLPELLEKLSDIKGLEWIRLMYSYPTAFPERILDVIAEKSNICKYIDIPFQHISDNILKSMKRGTGRRHIEGLINSIRYKIPGVAIRSTFITGYPGETDKDFKELYDFINDVKLERVGVFTYSHEENTSAYKLIDTVPEKIKQERRGVLMELQQRISLELNKAKIGKTLRVLVDEKKGNKFIGRTQHDAPEVDNTVLIKANKNIRAGDFADIKIIGATEYDLIGNY